METSRVGQTTQRQLAITLEKKLQQVPGGETGVTSKWRSILPKGQYRITQAIGRKRKI